MKLVGLLSKFEDYFAVTLVTCNPYLVIIELDKGEKQYVHRRTQYQRYNRKCSRSKLNIWC